MKKPIIAFILSVVISGIPLVPAQVSAQEKTPKSALSLIASSEPTKKTNTVLSMVFEEIGELQSMESELSKLNVSLQYERENPTQAEITLETREKNRSDAINQLNEIRKEIENVQKEIYVLKNPDPATNNAEENLSEAEIQKKEAAEIKEQEKQAAAKQLLVDKEKKLKDEEKNIKNKIKEHDQAIEALKQKVPDQQATKEITITELEKQVQDQSQIVKKQQQLIRQQIADLVSKIVILILLVLSVFIIRWIAFRLIQRLHMPLSRKAALSHIIRVSFNVIIALIVTGIVFSQFTNVLPFILLLGTGLAFAVRDSISSFIGWFIIGSDSGFHINDIVTLGEAHGKVKEINLLTSVIIQMDDHGETGKIISIPNKFIFDKPLINFSRSYGLSRIMINIEMQWGEDLEAAEIALMEALSNTIDSLINQADFSHQSYSSKLDRGKLHPQVAIHDKDEKIELSLVCFVPMELKYLAKQEIIRRFNSWLRNKDKKKTTKTVSK